MTDDADPTLDTTLIGRDAVPPSAPPPPRDPAADSRIGHYVLEGELGRGGMGVVHRARDTALGRSVALKMILDARSAGPEALARFRREAMATAKLRHPGIVGVFDVGEHEGKPFVVLELVEGESLAGMLARGPLEPRQAATVARDVARALAHAHEQGIVHRDVKPGNVLVDRTGAPRLMDFGLAHVAGDTTQLTRTGEILGTPAYMAPEQAGARAHGPPADVYGLGAVLYHALVGRPPFQASNLHVVLRQVLEDDPITPRKIRTAIPEDLETIVLRCLAKDPGRRYGSAEELAQDLDRFLAGEPIRARRMGRVERALRWVRRDRRLAAALVALAVVASVAFSAAARLALRDRERKELEDERAAATLARRAAIADVITSVVTCAVDASPSGIQDAVDRLAALRDPETAAMLADALDVVSDALAEGARAVYLSAQPTDEERARGVKPIEGLEEAARFLAVRSPTPPDPRTVEILFEAERRCCARAAANALGGARRMTALVAAEQTRRIGRGRTLLARVACEALGRLGLQGRAEEALGRYLLVERDALRASYAGEALFRIGGEENHALVRRTAWQRWDDLDGVFWQRVRPVLLGGPTAGDPGGATVAGEAAAVVSRAIERAHLLEAQGDGPQAVKELEAAIAATGSRSAVLWNNLGLVRGHEGDLAGAFASISRALELEPRAPAFWANRAWIRQQAGDLDGALEDAARAIELEPKFHGGWLNSGVARRGRGQLDEALVDLARAIELEPTDPIARFNRGAIRLERNELALALADLDRVLELRPGFAPALEVRSQVHRRLGSPGKSIADASKATEVAPRRASSWTELASAHLSNGDGAQAVAAATRAVELAPRNAMALMLLGSARASSGDVPGGLAALTSAIAVDPRCEQAIANRGSIRAATGDVDGAIEDLTRGIEINPRVPERWFNRGHARLVKGDVDRAIEDFSRAIELRPTLAQAWGDRGHARRRKGDVEGARQDYRRALELAPRMRGAGSVREALAELEQPAAPPGEKR